MLSWLPGVPGKSVVVVVVVGRRAPLLTRVFLLCQSCKPLCLLLLLTWHTLFSPLWVSFSFFSPCANSFLFDILTNKSVLRDRVPIFIACNKCDRMNAFSTDFIKKRLEKEIDVLLSTVGDLSDTKDDEENEVALTTTPQGEPFKFANCICPVTSGPISATKGNTKALKPFFLA